MIYTERLQDEIENTKVSETLEVEVPDRVVDAIASRLDVLDEPDEGDARDLAHDHVAASFRFVTTDGEPVEEVALERADGGVTLEYDESDHGADGDPDESPAPIDVDATAELDYASDPERPLSIELEIPAGVVDEDELDDVLETVSIDARIADE